MRPSLERELRLLEQRLRSDLRAELDQRLLELTRHVDDELEAMQTRIDTVHSRALRALTHRTERGAPRPRSRSSPPAPASRPSAGRHRPSAITSSPCRRHNGSRSKPSTAST